MDTKRQLQTVIAAYGRDVVDSLNVTGYRHEGMSWLPLQRSALERTEYLLANYDL
ncbi:MAG TPA: hypothetical protein VMD91_04630 [Candidatus Sulfotelmatobacter sp.]|nr:hypothetical protein [Candidatus Sulfotelmatobacter sp.]